MRLLNAKKYKAFPIIYRIKDKQSRFTYIRKTSFKNNRSTSYPFFKYHQIKPVKLC
ncbi:hypothetical protein CHRYSEO8AT_380022 [Chryseobacterium sp. 8AT]|nr:hypothetical protein CHRYSEO8AT_380022 [Chryseobacterium sp. 8AT]